MQIKIADGKNTLSGWLPQEKDHIHSWVADLVKKFETSNQPLHPTLQEFQRTIETSPKIFQLFNLMFEQIPDRSPYNRDPLDLPQIRDYITMLKAFNVLMQSGPRWIYTTTWQKAFIGAPFNAVLNWPMATEAGTIAFLMPEVNVQIKNMLNEWARYLSSPQSVSVLSQEPDGWLSQEALAEMSEVASGGHATPTSFSQAFICDPDQPGSAYGFKSWDDFFTRKFRPGMRPVASPQNSKLIANPCESSPYRIARGVEEHHRFWVKSQPYSLIDMLDNDPRVSDFMGGTVYQAFLSALSYHRWHAPISGTILSVRNIPGSYFAASYWEGFAKRKHTANAPPAGIPDPDSVAPVNSQAYTCHVATRALVLIQADDPRIGLVGLLFIGMGEVSSCEVTVHQGQTVCKGDQLGMFHYGGSTYCMLFEKDVNLQFVREGPHFFHDGRNLPVCGELAVILD